jgi:hypothetical protein
MIGYRKENLPYIYFHKAIDFPDFSLIFTIYYISPW